MRHLVLTVWVFVLGGSLWASEPPEVCKGPDILGIREWSDPTSFPELADPDLSVPVVEARKEKSFGIAFSGGGTRAAAATLGQLRAIHELEWLEQAQYVSAISGGSWTVVPFTFLPASRWDPRTSSEKAFTDNDFLGAYVEPGLIDRDALEEVPDFSFAKAISNARVKSLFLTRVLFRSDETYSRTLGKRILREFDLYEGERSYKCKGPARIVVAHHRQRERLQEGSQVKRIKGGQPWECLCPEDTDGTTLCDDEFLMPRADRPFLIVGATVLEKKRGKSNKAHIVELTPLYTGSRERFDFNRKGKPMTLGGGFVETAAYDSVAKWQPESIGENRTEFKVCFKRALSRYRYRLTLSDMMGASGAAPVSFLRGWWNTLGFPELNVRPIGPSTGKVFEFGHGDGGHADDLGLAALLARGVQNILAFANSQRAFCSEGDEKCPDKKGLRMASDIQCYFEQEPGSKAQKACQDKRDKKSAAVPTLFTKDGLDRILTHFEKLKKDNEPLIYCDQFEMIEEEKIDDIVKPLKPYTPRICWVQLDFNETWAEKVRDGIGSNDKLVKKLTDRRGLNFRNFPNYKTFGERFWKLRIIDMSEAQINALAHLTSWTVKEGSAKIERCLLSSDADRQCD